MKRIVIIAILIGFITPAALGQLKFGGKVGLVTSASSLDKEITNLVGTSYDELKLKAQDSKAGFQTGVFGRLTIVSFYFQPELMFTSTSSRVKVTKLYDEATAEPDEFVKTQSFKKIDIPLLFGGKIGPLRLQAGPVGTIVLDNKSAIEAAIDSEEDFNNATWGYQVGVGADLFKTITLDVKYEGSLSKLGESVTLMGNDYSIDNRTNQFIFSVGIFF